MNSVARLPRLAAWCGTAPLAAMLWCSLPCVSLALLPAAAAHAAAPTDHPLLSRMPGYVVNDKQEEDFGSRTFSASDLGHIVRGKSNLPNGKTTVEGKVTEIEYMDDKERTSPLAIYRNYLNAIKGLGGEAVNTVSNEDVAQGGRFLFKVTKTGATTWVALDLQNTGYSYALTIVEPKGLQQGVSADASALSAGQMAEQIKAGGFATLYIQFDTNRAELKADGSAAVTEIVKLLKADPALKLSIEGHTDNVGQAADNKKLSQARADAVLKAVVAQGIAAGRLKAVGHGQEVPVADNRTEEGRAKNRRVELVKQR